MEINREIRGNFMGVSINFQSRKPSTVTFYFRYFNFSSVLNQVKNKHRFDVKFKFDTNVCKK